MVKYRRYRVPGGTYFFTVALLDRSSNWLTRHIDELTKAMRRVREMHPFNTIAMVVLPEHLHVMWELPEGDSDFSLRWRCIKSGFARNLKTKKVTINKNRFGENIIWQRRFWEHKIRDERDYLRHFNYIHYNPVKHNLVKKVRDWPYSTFHRYVKEGILPKNWSDSGDELYKE